jgi:hypothetical protein
MWTQFIYANIHFALNLSTALVFFAVFWLHLDAWSLRKDSYDTFKIIGFLLLAVSYIVHALYVESSLIQVNYDATTIAHLSLALMILGSCIVCIGLYREPLQKRPVYAPLGLIALSAQIFFGPMGILFLTGTTVCIAILYLRRATTGLERHVKLVSYAFFCYSVSSLLAIGSTFRQTPNLGVYELVRSYGPLWTLEHLFLFAGTLVLGKWIFGYLLKRIQSQMFILGTAFITLLFLLITVSFSWFLMHTIEQDAMAQLETNANVLTYALENKKMQAITDAQLVAQNPQVIALVKNKSRTNLIAIAQDILLTKNDSYLVISDAQGKILARADDPSRAGESIALDEFFRRAILGQHASGLSIQPGIVAPLLSVRGAVPILDNTQVIGVVMTGSALDNAFTDGIYKATNLQVAIYGNDVLTASSLHGKELQGMKEENHMVRDTVLTKGKSYIGEVSKFNTLYLASYKPLVDAGGTPIGMLFVASPATKIMATVGKAMTATFFIAIVLLALSVFPSYLIAKYIEHQFH